MSQFTQYSQDNQAYVTWWQATGGGKNDPTVVHPSVAITIPPVTPAAVGTGLNTAVADFVTARVNSVMQVSATTGSPASLSIQLQGSMDNVNWYSIGSAVTSVGAQVTTTNIGFRFLRAAVTLTGGTNPTATVVLGGI